MSISSFKFGCPHCNRSFKLEGKEEEKSGEPADVMEIETGFVLTVDSVTFVFPRHQTADGAVCVGSLTEPSEDQLKRALVSYGSVEEGW